MGPFTWIAFIQAQRASIKERVDRLCKVQSSFSERDQLSLLSKGDIRQGHLLYSMAKIKDFKSVQIGQPAVCVADNGVERLVQIPDALIMLGLYFGRVNAWCYNITDDSGVHDINKSAAFKLIYIADDMPLGDIVEIRIDWGLTTGISSLVIESCMSTYHIKVSPNFDVSILVGLLGDLRAMRQFILDHAKLDRVQLELLRLNPNGF